MPRASAKQRALSEANRQRVYKRWKKKEESSTSDFSPPHAIHASAASYRHSLLPEEEREAYHTRDDDSGMKDSKPKASTTHHRTVPAEEITLQRQLQQLAHDVSQDQDDELLDDDLEEKIKEEVFDEEIPEALEPYHVEPTVKTKRDPDMIIPDIRPSTSYISVTPLHRVQPIIDESISPNTRLADMDEFHLFGMNVAAQLRALPLHDALQAELEIQRILNKKRSKKLS